MMAVATKHFNMRYVEINYLLLLLSFPVELDKYANTGLESLGTPYYLSEVYTSLRLPPDNNALGCVLTGHW